MTAKFLKKIVGGFTVRGRALAQVEEGMVRAKNNEPDVAIKHYTDVIDAPESPRDGKAMALFNRALVYSTISNELLATVDLRAVLNMPDAATRIKKSASDKLVRMQRKLEREVT